MLDLEANIPAEVLENLATAVWTETGESFFDTLAAHLHKLLGPDFIFIGDLTGGQLNTVCFSTPIGAPEKRVRTLPDALCEQLLATGASWYQSGLGQSFPEDEFLADLEVDAFLGTVLRDAGGDPIGVLMALWRQPRQHASTEKFILEILAQRAAMELKQDWGEKAAADDKAFLQTVLDGMPEPVTVFGLDHRIRLMNAAARDEARSEVQSENENAQPERLSGHAARCEEDRVPCGVEALEKIRSAQIHEQIETGGNGSRRVLNVQTAPVFNAAGEITAVVESKQDITPLRLAEEALQSKALRLDYLAHHDPLTELPNRTLFNDRLRHSLEHARRYNREVAILYLNLDRFKNVNDSLGHHIGDLLLVSVARRLARALRASDTVARLGGDEFVVLLERITCRNDAAKVARKIIDRISENYRVRNHEIHIGASVGISVFPDDGSNGDMLLKHADAAMYAAKNKGRGSYEYYSEGLSNQARSQLLIETNLSKALRNQEFELRYQPQVEIGSNRITGVEALLRWKNRNLGDVAPDIFIPVAEDSGLIEPIGEWVLVTACEQYKRWQLAGCAPARLAVNLSPRQFQQTDLISNVDRILTETEISPAVLTLEITEGVIMTDIEQGMAKSQTLSGMGVRISIDDFGTGYSSLGYLKRFTIDELKIDQSFVSIVPGDENSEAIARAIISLSRDLGYDVIAEGVETEEQVEFMAQNRCAYAQGHYYAYPVDADATTALLQRGVITLE